MRFAVTRSASSFSATSPSSFSSFSLREASFRKRLSRPSVAGAKVLTCSPASRDGSQLAVQRFDHGPAGKMAIGGRQIWRIGCQFLAALGEVTRRNQRRQTGRRDPIEPVPVLTECVERDGACRDRKHVIASESAKQSKCHPETKFPSCRRQTDRATIAPRPTGGGPTAAKEGLRCESPFALTC